MKREYPVIDTDILIVGGGSAGGMAAIRAKTMKELELKTLLAEKAQKLGAKIMNRTIGLQLLKNGDAVCGAVAIDIHTGEIVVIRAKSVILSAGGTARFGLPDKGHLYSVYDFPGNTGDGYMLAYHARAEMSGFEYTLVYYITKDINAPLLYITLTRGAHLLNAFNERLDKDHPSIKSMFAEHMKDHGPLHIELKHLPEEKIQEIEDLLFSTERPACQRFHEGHDNNFRTGEIELWPTEAFLCGRHGLTGVRINENGETNIPGLYAAGDTSLCARGHLSGAFVYGEICAENAGERAKSVELAPLDTAAVDAVINKIDRRMAQSGNEIAVDEFEYKVRRIIGDYLKPPKNAYKLNRALWWMKRFRQELDTVVRIDNVHDLFKALEIENIIECGYLSATASKERKETRWYPWHYRSDFPEPNDAEWKKHVVLTKGDTLDDVRVAFKDIIKSRSPQ